MAGGKTQGSISNYLGYAIGLMDQQEWNGKENPNKPYPQSIFNSNTKNFEQLPDIKNNNTSSGALVYMTHDCSPAKEPLKIVVAWKNSATRPRKLAYTKIYLAAQIINWETVKENLEIATSAAKDNVRGVTSSIEWNFVTTAPSVTIEFQVATEPVANACTLQEHP